MPKKKQQAKKISVTQWIFLLGLLVAIVGAIVSLTWITPLLLLIGLVIGVLQLWTTKETIKYIVATMGLILITYVLSVSTGLLTYTSVVVFFKNLVLLVTPGILFVSLKAFWESY